MIRCLPEEVRGKLRSGVAVPSLQQCVEELVLNSIDAGASCVGVRTDMEAFKVQVIDNGAGMSAEDMERVGNRYHTSKCNSLEDLDNLRWYGFRGEALASIVSLAALVEISSRTRSSAKTHVKMFKSGQGSGVFEAETARPSAGTTVVICSFFHSLPVRRKRMDAVLEGERVRHRLEAVSLMHPSVSFTLRNDCTGAMMVQLPKAQSTHHRFAQIHGLGRAQRLGEVGHTRGQFEVAGYIGREGHYNSSLQFLYVNHRLLLRTRIHKLLNFLLRRLSAAHQKNDSPDGQCVIRSPKHKRSQDLHGVYIINIKCSYSEYDVCLEPAKTLIEFRDWDGVLLCVEEAVKAFLSRENLVAELSQDDLDYVSPGLFFTDRDGDDCGGAGRATSGASTLDCGIGMKLASEPVHRKLKEACGSEASVCQEPGLMEHEDDEAEKIPVNDLETTQSEGCVRKTLRGEPRCDQDPPPECDFTEEEEPTFSKAEGGSQTSLRPLEGENQQISKEREMQLNDTTSSRNVTLSDSIPQQGQPDLNGIVQLLPECQTAGGDRQALISNRKVSLSDPFIHQSLQTQDRPQINKSVSGQQNQTGEKRSFASKCKISLDTGQGREGFAPVAPTKIPRVESSQRLAFCKESGSLDRFRRVFGKADEIKLPSLDLHNNARHLQANSLIVNTQNLLVRKKDQQDGDVTQTQEMDTQGDLQSPAAPSVFTRLKPPSAPSKGKKSLSAKLCHLKQRRTEGSEVLPRFSGTTAQDGTCLNGGGSDVEDSNNNENPRDAVLNPEPGSGFSSTNARLAQEEEDTTTGDWLHHYDTSVGKTVYVNRVTGLSKYEEPSTEETRVRCMSDVTNMAVNVISETGRLGDIIVTGNSKQVISKNILSKPRENGFTVCFYVDRVLAVVLMLTSMFM